MEKIVRERERKEKDSESGRWAGEENLSVEKRPIENRRGIVKKKSFVFHYAFPFFFL